MLHPRFFLLGGGVVVVVVFFFIFLFFFILFFGLKERLTVINFCLIQNFSFLILKVSHLLHVHNKS